MIASQFLWLPDEPFSRELSQKLWAKITFWQLTIIPTRSLLPEKYNFLRDKLLHALCNMNARQFPWLPDETFSRELLKKLWFSILFLVVDHHS
jgi:hypothetical protein